LVLSLFSYFLMGRITGLVRQFVRLSVRLSVPHELDSNWKTRSRVEKPKSLNVLKVGVTGVPVRSSEVKRLVLGRVVGCSG